MMDDSDYAEASSYSEMMGTPMDVDNHPATKMKNATQHYAGTVIPVGGSMAPANDNFDTSATDYALSKQTSPKVTSIGPKTLKNWAKSQLERK